jgi:hypothetical protein
VPLRINPSSAEGRELPLTSVSAQPKIAVAAGFHKSMRPFLSTPISATGEMAAATSSFIGLLLLYPL